MFSPVVMVATSKISHGKACPSSSMDGFERNVAVNCSNDSLNQVACISTSLPCKESHVPRKIFCESGVACLCSADRPHEARNAGQIKVDQDRVANDLYLTEYLPFGLAAMLPKQI
jgi:hypothetical protein